ncbi:MAG TPA: chalcone isomerase family protein [Thiopseudomonas sp.]|nr:chalcone isomerase family protein [Thiopseudomonas sp.]
MRILCCFILLALANLASAKVTQVGEGVVRWGVFKLYHATFFTEAQVSLRQALADDKPARLELCYVREFSVENFIDGAQLGLPASLTPQLQAAVTRLHQAYQAVQPGDCYRLDYQPGQGTALLLNDKELVRVATAGFKALYFGIWLGDKPLSAQLKRDLTQGLAAEQVKASPN